jgi:DHA1 family bicyclomycin/chloramphenicol resistance-like MFS transporter
MSIIGMGLGVAPAVGPIIAGYLQVRYGWPAIFVALAVIAGAILLFVALAMPETNTRRNPAATRWRSIANNYRSIAADRGFVSYVAVLALTTAGTYNFIAAAPFVLISKLDLTPDRFGALMPLLVVAYFLAAAVTTKLLGPVSPDRLVRVGIGVAAVAALALFGLAQAGVLTVAVALAAMMLWMVGIALLTPGVTAGALQPFPVSAGSAAALMGFAQMLGGGIGSAVSAMLGGDPELIFGLVPACFALLGALIYGLLLGRMAKMGPVAS